MKHSSLKTESAGCAHMQQWRPELFEEITDLLAEALYKDFQEHRRVTVNSTPGMNHANLLTPGPQRA
jgi:hypothetical protein